LSITATDTAVLCGTYPKTCWRRYLAKTTRTDFLHELGIRILTGYVIRIGARFDIAAEPIFAHSKHHYYRVYFKMSKGANKSNKLLDQVKIIEWNSNELGPLWFGDLWDKSLVKKVSTMHGKFNTKKHMVKLLDLIKEEMDLPPLYSNVHKICKSINSEVPPFKLILQALKKRGIKASRTSFSPTGIRANCDIQKLKQIIGSIPS
jgi:tRNA (guanine26-N2/guanine27-N2)-dimethyltransferase